MNNTVKMTFLDFPRKSGYSMVAKVQ